MQRNDPQPNYLRDYKVSEYLIDVVDLEIDLDEKVTKISSDLTIKPNPESKSITSDLVLQGEKLEFISICLDSKPLQPTDYELTDKTLRVHNVPRDRVFHLQIQNCVRPNENTDLQGLYQSQGNFVTQCETEGFRRITYFIDRPDILTRYVTKLIADKSKYPILLSNGNLLATGDLPHNRHWVKWEDPFKKPSYLFALVAGNFDLIKDTYLTKSKRKIELQIYAEKGDAKKCYRAMKILKRSMLWDEENYGRECDLDVYKIVAISDFTAGAQENKGLNIFNAKNILSSQETTTDDDAANMEAVISHEYFHNWTGNRVTIRDWFQLSLKEGLTTFREESFAEDTSTPASRINVVDWLRNNQFVEDAGPLARPVQVDSYLEVTNVYTSTAYQKGAEIFRMIQTYLGKDIFRKGMDLYFERHDGKGATIELFVTAMEDASKKDLSQFLLWFRQPGTPILEVIDEYSPEKKEYILTLKQSYPRVPDQIDKKPVPIPVKISLLNDKGEAIPLQRGLKKLGNEVVLLLRNEESKYCFSNVPQKPVLSLLRGFSAPVRVKSDYKTQRKILKERAINILGRYNKKIMLQWQAGKKEFELHSHDLKILEKHDLKILAKYDSDPVSRWSAIQRYFCLHILDMVREYQNNVSNSMFGNKEIRSNYHIQKYCEDLSATLKFILESKIDDLQIVTQMTILPSEKYLVEQLGLNDIDAAYEIRKYLLKSIAVDLKRLLLTLYVKYDKTDNQWVDQFEPEAIGKRSLKNNCLAYLMQLNDPEIIEITKQQFDKSLTKNMTDTIAALRLLVNVNAKERDEALNKFYKQWSHDSHTMNYWFEIQAASELPDTLERIDLLLKHEAFDIKNPNKVRAILESFSGNVMHFHRLDGAGYALFAKVILKVDAINPEVAAQEVAPLLNWKYYDMKRQMLMRQQLQAILAGPDISINLKEVVAKGVQKPLRLEHKENVVSQRNSEEEPKSAILMDDLTALSFLGRNIINTTPKLLVGIAAAGAAYFFGSKWLTSVSAKGKAEFVSNKTPISSMK